MSGRIPRKFLRLSVFVFLLSAAVTAVAQPVQNPSNGHYYELIRPGANLNWQAAANDASSRSHLGLAGHLVTITSQQENDFLVTNLDIPQNSWIGAFQPPGTPEPNTGWQWLTGETFGFTSWAAGEPNDAGNNEDCAHWWINDGEWNDINCANTFATYVIEFDDLGRRATFFVTKQFNDGNEAEVRVTLTCNTGLPLQQTFNISEGNPVNFVVKDFEPGTLDCVVTEVVPSGYTASYNDGTVSSSNCSWNDIAGGPRTCAITNSLNLVEVEVTKDWIDANPQFDAVNIAEAEWACTNVAFGNWYGYLEFIGDPDSASFFVYPDWESGTSCSITEISVADGGVEVDDSDCQGLVLFPGVGASCTIVNTRLYEGIPTLSQYGLAVLALLMLGAGFVAFRRLT